MLAIIKCSKLNECIFYIRNSRDRDNDSTLNGNKYDKHDEIALIYVDILDNLHTHFIHSYQTGYRLKRNNDDYHNNNEIKLMKSILKNKREHIKSVRGYDRIKNNKFLTNFDNNKKQKHNELFMDKMFLNCQNIQISIEVR